MVQRETAEPLANAIKASELMPGMEVYYRVVGDDGHVKFRLDLKIKEIVTDSTCRGVHVRTVGGHTVCYHANSLVWVRTVDE